MQLLDAKNKTGKQYFEFIPLKYKLVIEAIKGSE